MYISNLYIICGAVLKTVYTINGFSSLLTTSPLYQEQETEEKKLLLLDRCNWLITRIAIINIYRNEPVYNYVNLHSVYLKKYLTNWNYKDIENCLIDLGIIEGEGVLRYEIEQLPLLPATYLVTTAVHDGRSHQCYDFHKQAYSFQVSQGISHELDGVVLLPARWLLQSSIQKESSEKIQV